MRRPQSPPQRPFRCPPIAGCPEVNPYHAGGDFQAPRIDTTGVVGGDHRAPRIEACDAAFATKLVGYLIGDLIRVVRENVSESAHEKAKKRMLQIVAQAGAKGVLKGELTRKTQFIRRALRDEYLADLVESGEIAERPAQGGSVSYALKDFTRE